MSKQRMVLDLRTSLRLTASATEPVITLMSKITGLQSTLSKLPYKFFNFFVWFKLYVWLQFNTEITKFLR